MEKDSSRSRQRIEQMVLGLIALAALVLRLYYVRTAYVSQPVRGDAVQYYSYAWNMIHHCTFSGALPHAALVAPDSFRDPGYPSFLAAVAGSGQMEVAFVQRVLDVQCLLSAWTVWVFAILARRWVSFGAAIGTGMLLALWPHTITLAGYVLSETLLGFLTAVALFMTDEAMRRRGSWRPVAAGALFALAGLTNAVMAPFAPMLAVVMAWRDRERRGLWVLLLVAAIVPLASWSIRSASLPTGDESSGNRAKMNLVQGAWPEYHTAYIPSFNGDTQAIATMKSIDDEYKTLRGSTTVGLAQIARRLAGDPGRYMRWYLSKPLELWGWEIGIGAGDIYVYPTYRSPLLLQPVLSSIVGAMFFIWPLVLILALAGAVLALLPAFRASAGLRVAALLGVWVTFVYGVLQSDARYSTPFRGIEAVLAAYAVHAAIMALRKRRPEVG